MKTLKVVKIGGNIIDDAAKLNPFLASFAAIKGPKILVHGGGKLATQWIEKMNVPVKMIDGRRVTNLQTLDVVTMIYGGKINKSIVAQLQANDCNALGFSGADGNTILAQKRPIRDVDYGFVGDIIRVNTEVIKPLLSQDITLAFCALSHDGKGQLLNTNADTIASELATALSKDFEVELYYCFEKKGVLRNVDDDDSVIECIDASAYKNLRAQKIIADGMIPKLTNCFDALDKNVHKVCIGNTGMLFQPNSKFTNVIK
ncbi:acetylglutamate kinase [Aureisphaera galaxeae]|uniref:acetylglutamate kinase n=1 Tax=Aureisphaera galaxeae TaxID=1538023 RepID=UPI002350CD8C|nr:acetylglutamate kinase [Aureisphaera galaxeae]MDC8005838.1 acetylglutamate kinase [Aureisphaera galaxeae]